jgi:UDP-glucuronate 4-epimerase
VGKTVLVTGAAGFIGSHTAEALARRGDTVVGLDNFDPYYDPRQKRDNVQAVRAAVGDGLFSLVEGDVRDRELVQRLFSEHAFDAIVHLAALANVRYSIGKAEQYFDVNLTGTIHLLDAAVAHGSPNFVFASTSSVYGATERLPFTEDDPCDRPLAPYPASKRACEMLGYSYHSAHGLDFTALRFFTVYGPRNRPDMMAYKLLQSVVEGTPVTLFARGQLKRDWTFVGDIAAGIVAAVDRRPGYEVLNLGRGEPVLLADFVEVAEKLAGGRANIEDAPRPAADVPATYANIQRARERLGYEPQTSVKDGMARVWEWYQRTRRQGD